MVRLLAGSIMLQFLLMTVCGAVTLEYSQSGQGALDLSIRHTPKTEPLGVLEVTFVVDPAARMVIASSPTEGPWALIPPELYRSKDTIRVLALAPSLTNWSDAESATVLTLSIYRIPAETAPLTMIDTVFISAATDLQARSLSLTLELSQTKTIQHRTLPAGNLTFRRYGRIHALSFHLRETVEVRASILDMEGKIVRRLANSRMNPGMHEVRWDGLSGSGKRVASGTYFINLQTGSSIVNKRVRHLP